VLAGIISQVIDDYRPALDGFERDAVEAEATVFDETRTQPVRRLYNLKRQVRELLIAIDALQDPLARLLRTCRNHWPVRTFGL
jgi:Mg2+ and Co2+ transporter CorA